MKISHHDPYYRTARRNRLLIAGALVLALLAGAASARAQAGPTCAHDVTLIAHTSNTFTYRITSGGPPGLSHVDLYLCTRQVASVSWPYSEIKTGFVRFDDLDLEACKTQDVTVSMSGIFTPQPTSWHWKAGQQTGSGTTSGPTCGPNAVRLHNLTARPLGLLARVRLALAGWPR